MIGSFGSITFRVSDSQVQNFHSLSRKSSARYASHEVIGTKPKQEFLGPGLDTLSFTMELNASLGVSPMAVIRRLDGAAKEGTVSRFILGGRNMGRFVLVSKSEAYEIITGQGDVLKAKVDVELEEYR